MLGFEHVPKASFPFEFSSCVCVKERRGKLDDAGGGSEKKGEEKMGSGGKEEKDGRPSLADGLNMSAEEKEKEGGGRCKRDIAFLRHRHHRGSIARKEEEEASLRKEEGKGENKGGGRDEMASQPLPPKLGGNAGGRGRAHTILTKKEEGGRQFQEFRGCPTAESNTPTAQTEIPLGQTSS